MSDLPISIRTSDSRLGQLPVCSGSLLAQFYTKANPILVAATGGADIVVTYATFQINRIAYRRIDDLEATAFDKWARNDVGTCLYIMAMAYGDLEMYKEAAAAWRSLADDYQYTQCWDPKGWFWRPAENAVFNADYYEKQAPPW